MFKAYAWLDSWCFFCALSKLGCILDGFALSLQPAGAAPNLRAEEYQRAMKYSKYACSALQYEDSATAIENLTKALRLLTTGQDK